MKSSIYSSVTDAVASAKGAYGRYIKLTLNERQEILEGVKKALRPIANELAAMTVSETGTENKTCHRENARRGGPDYRSQYRRPWNDTL